MRTALRAAVMVRTPINLPTQTILEVYDVPGTHGQKPYCSLLLGP